ncbi:MAG: hypothetical protein ACLFUS_12270 [Candidatus Sumerlaeia bacterium]
MFENFPKYTNYDPKVPVWCLTPNEGRCIHRFFDTSPISPSGEFAAVLRLPFEDRLNQAGDAAQVVLINLKTGEEKVVAETCGWEPQMGANINWGGDDHALIFNDVDTQTWTPQIVKLDPQTGKKERIEGGVYHVSPDGRYAAASSTDRMCRTQVGYGVFLPEDRIPRNIGARDDDGLFITDLETGERKLVFTLAQALEVIPAMDDENPDDWEIYGFHCKWSPQGDRLIFTIRRFPKEGENRFNLINCGHKSGQQLRFDVLTLKPDGSDVHNAVPSKYWDHGGHHINWYPDGKSLSMNLGGFGDGLSLVRVGYDGSDIRPIVENFPGSGHPSVHPDGKHMVADTYAWDQRCGFGDGTIPIRWIDTTTATEECLVRIGAVTEPKPHPALRVDPHPAWHRNWEWLSFNGVLPNENTRRVFLADLKGVIG